MNPASKGCRLNFGDEAMIEIITDIRQFTEGSKRGAKAENALKHANSCLTVSTTITKNVVVLASLHYEHDWRSW